MKKKRRKFSAKLKAKIALEALKGDRPLNKIASEYGVHPNQITKWKKQLLEGASDVFSGKQKRTEEDWEAEKEKLFAQIGQLQYENNWVKKKLGLED
ncbi:MAG: transposase [Planctomycetes bacterium]|nr:transposase [Planctomycetota bacterium]